MDESELRRQRERAVAKQREGQARREALGTSNWISLFSDTELEQAFTRIGEPQDAARAEIPALRQHLERGGSVEIGDWLFALALEFPEHATRVALIACISEAEVEQKVLELKRRFPHIA